MNVRAITAVANATAKLAALCNLPQPSASGTVLIGGFVEDEIIGFVEYRQVLDEAELIAIGVHPDQRGRGHGTHLLEAFIEALTSPVRVFLEVREDNDAARALYERRGFQLEGRRARYYRDGTDALIYGRSIA